jgi:predicted PhzF superfamily epimerase YddE/YHI9
MHETTRRGQQAHAVGGHANVYWLPEVSPDSLLAEAESILAAYSASQHTAVLLAGAAGHYVAESFSPAGARIQFCGHGALAAAWLVLNEREPLAQSVAFTNKERSWQARRSESLQPDMCIALLYSRPSSVACAVPEFALRCFGSQPLAAAMAGAATDYLIVEMNSAQTVQNLQPDFALLTVATDRALIATARASHFTNADANNQPGCVFRYFAPQYGAPEDGATGSAAVQLAAYWSPRVSPGSLALRQLSPQGAVMRVACHADTVELLARVGYG